MCVFALMVIYFDADYSLSLSLTNYFHVLPTILILLRSSCTLIITLDLKSLVLIQAFYLKQIFFHTFNLSTSKFFAPDKKNLGL